MGPLEERIGYRFRDDRLLSTVLTHRSYRHENPAEPAGDNERLEFLGDSVLGFLVSRQLFERFAGKQEGELSRLRAHLVSASHLADKARRLDLGQELRLGRGEELSGGRDKESILADAYESLIAGVFLDGGLDAAELFVVREFETDIARFEEAGPLRDDKSHLQERLHAQGRPEPHYRTVAEEGPEHRKRFEVVVEVGGAEAGRGHGRSKKAAQQEAARQALAWLERIAEPDADAAS